MPTTPEHLQERNRCTACGAIYKTEGAYCPYCGVQHRHEKAEPFSEFHMTLKVSIRAAWYRSAEETLKRVVARAEFEGLSILETKIKPVTHGWRLTYPDEMKKSEKDSE